MTRAGASRFWDAIARRYDREFALVGGDSRAELARVLGLIKGHTNVLDLGVGTGRALGALQDAGHCVTGFDISEEMLERCGRRARPVPLVLGDLWTALPFEDASFDAAISLHGTLAHPPDDDAEGARRKFGDELARVLRPGGLLVAELPSFAWLKHATSDTLSVSGSTFRFRDSVSGVEITGGLATESEWRKALARFTVEFEDRGQETVIVARRGA